MKRKNELEEVGKTYGDYTIVRFYERKNNNLYYAFKCNVCGREHIANFRDLAIKGIGNTHKACIRQLPKNETTKKLRNIWSHIVDRCTNKKCEHYKSYGGRGITCQYKLFIDFYDDFHDSYVKHAKKYGDDNTTIDRIDPNRNYEKDNMRWATWETQYKNKNWQKYKAEKEGTVIIGTAKQLAEIIGCCCSSISEVTNHNKAVNSVYGYKITKL